MSLSLQVFLQLAAAFAPSVAPETLASFAQNESRLDPYAIHDNSTGASLHPDSLSQAVALATALLAQRHSLDLGIMQVNSVNFARLALNVTSAFDPGHSIRAGAVILVEAYQQCRRDGAVPEQPALRCAASVYNTGREQAGILNGYQARVWQAAAIVVPAIQLTARPAVPPGIAPDDVVTPRPRTPREVPTAAFEDALHPSPPTSNDEGGLADALHLPDPKDIP